MHARHVKMLASAAKNVKKLVRMVRLPSIIILPRSITKNVRVADKDQALNNEKVQAAKAEAEEMLRGDGRILLRKSGTEPVIRIMAECSRQDLCEKCVDHILSALKAENLMK